MPSTQLSKDLCPLCHEHHREMRLHRSSLNPEGDGAQAIVYACTEPDCLGRYNTSAGYFILRQNRSKDEMDVLPKVTCILDGAPMYLAEINPEKRGFRLWTCPKCGAKRTNEEGLVGLASQ